MSKVIKLADYKRPCKHKDFILDYNLDSVICKDCETYLNPLFVLSNTIDEYNELQVEYERLRHSYNEIKGILMARKKPWNMN